MTSLIKALCDSLFVAINLKAVYYLRFLFLLSDKQVVAFNQCFEFSVDKNIYVRVIKCMTNTKIVVNHTMKDVSCLCNPVWSRSQNETKVNLLPIKFYQYI